MIHKLVLFDLKYSLRSKVTLLLLGIFFLFTLSGTYIGTLKVKEINLLQRGNEKVVQITNMGNFTHKIEDILDQSLRFCRNAKEDRVRFLASRLVEFWLLSGVIGIILYGHFFLIQERSAKVIYSLLICPMRLQDYYMAKVVSGFCFWGIFFLVGGSLLAGIAYFIFQVTFDFFISLFFSLLALWLYQCLLWLCYLLISFSMNNVSKVGAFLLILVLAFSFFVPGLVNILVSDQLSMPEIPKIQHSLSIHAFSVEREWLEDDRQFEVDLQNVISYREQMLTYLKRGVSIEEHLAYFSPFLLFERVMKSYFRPEIIFYEELLNGISLTTSISVILKKQISYFMYLGVVVSFLFLFSFVLLSIEKLSVSFIE